MGRGRLFVRGMPFVGWPGMANRRDPNGYPPLLGDGIQRGADVLTAMALRVNEVCGADLCYGPRLLMRPVSYKR